MGWVPSMISVRRGLRAAVPTVAAFLCLVSASPSYPQYPPGGGNQTPVIVSLITNQVAGQKFRISGRVQDNTPGSCTVALTGAAVQTLTCAADGTFDAVVNVPTLGAMTAKASDGVNISTAVNRTLANTAPGVMNFIAAHSEGNTLTLSGMVTDEAAPGLFVAVSGPGFDSSFSTVGATGQFSITVPFITGFTGTATATVTDWYGATGSATTLIP